MRQKFVLATTLCLTAFSSASVIAADEMSVQVKKTQVREKDSYLSKTLCELHYGDRVIVVKKGSAWLLIRPADLSSVERVAKAAKDAKDKTDAVDAKAVLTAEEVTGYVNKSALTTKRIVLKADQSAQTHTSSEDVTLAGKGFNDEVERSYKSEHPNLAAAFASLDAIEMNEAFAPTMEEVSAFREAGGLEGGAE